MKSFYQFEVKGYNQEKFFNELSKFCKVFDINRISKEHSFFKTNFFDHSKAEKLINEFNLQIISVKKTGIFSSLSKILTSYGLITGFIIGLVLLVIDSCFIRKIEVWGNEKISDKEVIEVVDDSIGNGFKSKIDTKIIESLIYSNFESLSFVSVAVVGQTIIVNIKEELIPEEMTGNFLPVISNFDGRITKTELIQGTLCVKVGDIVQKGDTLVLPYITNSSGEQMPVKAMANIWADVWIIEEEIHNSCYEEVYRTGKKIINNEIFLFSLKIYEKKQENVFENYEIVESVSTLNKNNLLPFVLKTTTIYETATKLVEIPFSQVKDSLIEKAKAKALQKVEEYEIIKEERVDIREVGNITSISYIITLNRKIGE